MAPDDPSEARPQPVVLRIKLRYPDIDTMVQRFAPNVGKSGLFLPTRTMHPVGTELKFELRLSTDAPVLVGMGRVKEARQPEPNNPRAAFGLAIELMRVTREGRDLILQMLERRRALGLSDVPIPVPTDIAMARRLDVETNPRIVLPPPGTPAAVVNEPSSAPVMTAPRRSTGQMVAQKPVGVEPLAPEPPRKKRVPLGELIGSVVGESGPVAAAAAPVFDDDEVVDVGKALARARALAGNDLDKELEVLLDSAATPVAIDVEAASAELARQLGGVAVRRGERSARGSRWAPPPAVTEAPSAATSLVEATAAVVEDAPASSSMAAALDAVAEQLAVPVSAPIAAEPEPVAAVAEPAVAEPEIIAPEPAETAVDVDGPPSAVDDAATRMATRDVLPPADDDDEPDDSGIEESLAASAGNETRDESVDPSVARGMIHDRLDPDEFSGDDGEQVVEPEQIDDEIHQLDDADYEEVGEETYAGQGVPDDEPEPATFLARAPNALEARLDRELAEAEAEADADDMGIGTRALPVGTYNRRPSDFSATADGEDDYVERPSSDFLPTLDGEPAQPPPPLARDADGLDAPSEELDLDASEAMHADEIDLGDEGEGEGEEIDDFEILAESDAVDDDPPDADELLDPASIRPSVSDFALHLDLPEDSELLKIPRRIRGDRAEDDEAEDDPRERSAGAALAAFEDDEPSADDSPARRRRGPRELYDEPISSSYTAAERLGDIDPRLDARFAQFDESDVIALPPSARKPTPTPVPQEADLDLESALEALDVDLDDLSIPHASTELRRDVARNAGARKPARAATDDGVLIDFDDDE